MWSGGLDLEIQPVGEKSCLISFGSVTETRHSCFRTTGSHRLARGQTGDRTRTIQVTASKLAGCMSWYAIRTLMSRKNRCSINSASRRSTSSCEQVPRPSGERGYAPRRHRFLTGAAPRSNTALWSPFAVSRGRFRWGLAGSLRVLPVRRRNRRAGQLGSSLLKLWGA